MQGEDDELSVARRSLEMQKLRAEARKAALDVELLEQKLRGREKPTRWTIAKDITVCAGLLFTALSYCKSLRDAHQTAYQISLGHYRSGSVTAVVELGAMGPEGVRELVYGVRPVRSADEPTWPQLTLATLGELKRIHDRDRKKLGSANLAQLVKSRDANEIALRHELTAIEKTNRPPTPDARNYLRELACVQFGLQNLTGPPADATWTQSVRPLLDAYLHLPVAC